MDYRILPCLLALTATLTTSNLFADAGDLYVAEIDEASPAQGAVERIGRDGTKHPFASPIGDPYGVLFDRERQLLVASDPGNAIYRYSTAGAKTTFASGVNGAIGLAQDSAGNIYCAAIRANSIIKITPSGIKSTLASGISQPIGVALDATGNVYTGGLNSGTITKISPGGTKSTFAAGLSRPYSLLFDKEHNLLVAERGAGVVSKFTPSGTKSTFLTDLISPFGMIFDADGNLFISEHDASRITKVTPEGVRSVFASDLKAPAFMAFEPATGNPVNISSRLRVGIGENVLIGGFIITGNAAKKIAVRAIGPSLSNAGLTNTLPDPVLELHDQAGATIATNDDWQDTQAVEVMQANLAPTDNREAALVLTLPPGPYTAIVRGKAETEGVGLVEVYDLDPAADSRLANISTRGFVSTGDNVMIGGFIVSDNGARVIVRAIGPSLSQAGISNALADPILTLFDSNGVVLAANDNWKDTQQGAIGASGLAPKNDLESAIIATLPTGAYTAIVSGNNDPGVGLVELYAVD